jgi:hypothetical protein
MTEQEVFVLADRTLNDVVSKIADDRWNMRIPASFARRGAGERVSAQGAVPHDAPSQDRLLGLIDRDPKAV